MNKTIILSLFFLGGFALNASAQTSKDTIFVFSIADSINFTGKYKYEGLPFEYMEVNVKDGKLSYTGGEYNGMLEPIKDKKDAFAAAGNAIFTFLRNSDNKVAELKIDYQERSYLGKREEKKN